MLLLDTSDSERPEDATVQDFKISFDASFIFVTLNQVLNELAFSR